MSRLDEAAVSAALRRTPGWERGGGELRRTYRFREMPKQQLQLITLLNH